MPVSAATSAVLPWSMWPAVPSVRGVIRRHSVVGERAAVEQHAGPRCDARRPPADRRPQRGRQRVAAVERAGEARRARAAAGRRRRPGPRVAHHRRRRAARPARSPARARRPPARAAAAQHRHLAQRPLRVAVELERRLERGQRQLVDPHRAGERVAPDALDRVGRADDHAGLRAAEQLVAREADHGRAGLDRLDRAVGSSARSGRSSSWPEPRSSITGTPCSRGEVGELAERRGVREADDAEVRLVDAQDGAGLRPDRGLVVGEPACGWSCRPRPAARPTARARRGCGSRRRSRSAPRG